MKHKLFALLAVVLLIGQMSLLTSAQETPEGAVRSAYWSDGAVYAFAHLPQAADGQEVSLMVNSQLLPGATPVRWQDAAATMHYLFLIDASSSMGQYRGQLYGFVREFLQAQSGNLDVSVATLGSSFQVVASGLTDWDAVQTALWKTSSRTDGSDICGGVASALEYLGAQSYPAGDLVNLVLVTDGEPWYSNDQELELSRELQAAQAAAARMDVFPEIVLHTLCLHNWEQTAASVLSAGRGLHLTAGTTEEAQTAGKALADFSSTLWTVTFPLEGYADVGSLPNTMLLCVGDSWFSIGNLRNIDAAPDLEPEGMPQLPPVDASASTDPTQETAPPEGSSETSQDLETVPGQATAPDAASGRGAIIAVIVAAVAVLAIAAGLLLRKRRKARGAVRMRVEVLAGEVSRLKRVYFLSDEIRIGTGRQCHIVIRSPEASPVTARIFKQGQLIYIEDQGSPCGTVLNGMRLYTANRLRSADEVAIGSVVLRFLF